MSKRRRTWNAVGLCLFFGIIFFAALYDPAAHLREVPEVVQPDFLFEQVLISNLEDGVPTWKVHAKSAVVDKRSGETVLNFMSGEFFQGEKVLVALEAPKALIRLDNSDMHLLNANARYSLGSKWVDLRADSLIWHSRTQDFAATGNVWIKSGALALTGQRFFVSLPIRRMRMADQAHATYVSDAPLGKGALL